MLAFCLDHADLIDQIVREVSVRAAIMPGRYLDRLVRTAPDKGLGLFQRGIALLTDTPETCLGHDLNNVNLSQ